MVLYQPKEVQKYVYYVEDHPEVFWIHFTGYDVKNILEYHGISLDQHVFYSGTLPEYKMLFRKIIRELQQCEDGYEDYIASLFNNILLLVSRQQQNGENYIVTIPEEIEMAVSYFNENYNTKISVAQYAESLHITSRASSTPVQSMEIFLPSWKVNSTHPVSMLNLQALASYFIIASSNSRYRLTVYDKVSEFCTVHGSLHCCTRRKRKIRTLLQSETGSDFSCLVVAAETEHPAELLCRRPVGRGGADRRR